MYTMKKTAELTGLSEHTLRYYDKEGLLPGLARDGVGRRVFSDEDLFNIRTIRALREMGVPIARIRDFIAAGRGERALERRGEIIAERTARAKAELEALKDQLKLLARAAEYCRGAQAGSAIAALAA